MDDVRLFGNDGDYLILEALDGQKFRLLSDDSLKSAIKREPAPSLDAITLTPREIQDHIRNGQSIDEIATSSGASFAFVEKFAAPVLDELAHMVDSAKSVRITTSQDRYSDSTHVEFGELVETRLGNSGASNFAWKAKRGDFNSWNVSVHFLLSGEESHAAWSFDPRKLTLSPENESAVNLSTNDPLSSTPIPKLRPVLQAEPESLDPAVDHNATAVLTPPTEISKPFTSPSEPETILVPAPSKNPSGSWITQLVPLSDENKAAEPNSNTEPDAPLSATADLLQALRIKRGEREAAAEMNLNTNHSDEQVVAPLSQTDVAVEPETQTPPAIAKKGRAAMPSWDQIVFGTKTED